MEKKIVIKSTVGLHASLAAKVVQSASKYDVDIKLHYKDKVVDVKSILGLMSLAIPSGENVVLVATGDQALTAIEEIEKLKEYEGMEYNTRLLEDLSTITFDGDANQTANQLNMLFSQSGLVKKSNSNESNHKEVYKAIAEKVELGIMHLQSLNDISHVEYFQKKLKKFKLLKSLRFMLYYYIHNNEQ